jgi:predicted ATPase/predicted Ser/Thr protein kinase
LTQQPLDPWLGNQLAGRYELQRRLGSGAVGRVYLARQQSFDRVVAVKLLRTDTTPEHFEQNRKRFRREAEQLSRLSHPNVVRLYDYGHADTETAFLVMEYLEGRTLRAAMGSEPMEPRAAVGLIHQILRGLRHCHDRGVVHRDLKPDNVLLVHDDGGERAVLVDFGISRDLEESSDMTRGTFLGTPTYAAPEQATDDPIDHRSDLYAVGVLLFHMLTGAVPFRGKSGAATMFLHLQATVPTLASRDVEVDAVLEGIVARCLAKQPDDRWPDAATLRRALAAWQAGEAIPGRGAEDVPALQPVALPPDPEPLGRGSTLRSARQLLREHRLVTLVGPGGIGKSAVAVHLAHTAVGGLVPVYADLGDTRAPADVTRAVASAVGEDPEGEHTWTLPPALRSLGPALLILDNADHAATFAGVTLARWLETAPELRILATSRRPLAVQGERTCEVEPLEWDDAVQLFLDRARAVHPSYGDDDADTVGRLVSALDRRPLAIQLAAERATSLSPAEIVDRLRAPLSFLRSRRRGGSPRHRSLRASLDWSWQQLDQPARTALSQLALFGGTVRRDAVAAVVDPGAGADPLEVLAALRGASWLRSVDEYGEARLELWSATAAYVRERWEALPAETRDAAAARYVAWALRRSTELRDSAVGPGAAEAAQAQHDELADLLAAHDLAMGDADTAAALLTALVGPMRHGDRADHLRRLEATLALGPSPTWHLTLLNQIASVTGVTDRERARVALDQCLALLDAHEELDPSLTWLSLGNLELLAGDRQASQTWYERALSLLEVRGDERGHIPLALNNLALVAISAGRLGAARDYLNRALTEHERVGALPGVALARLNLGDLALAVRDHSGAKEHYRIGADVFAQLGDRMRATVCVTRAGLIELDKGRPRAAEPILRGGLVGMRSGGFVSGVGETLTWLAVARADQGDPHEAERLLEDAARLYSEVTRRVDEARVHLFLGALQACRGATALAGRSIDRASQQLAHAPDPRLQWAAAVTQGLVDQAEGQLESARHILGTARRRHGKRTPAGTSLEIRVLARWLERELAAPAPRAE